MQLERRGRPRYGIALTSLVDVVFILLFFFMLAARAQPQAALELRLAQPAASAAQPTMPVVEVLGAGRLRSANRDFTVATLAAQFPGISALRLRAMPGSELQDLVDALDAAHNAGLSADWVR